MRKNYVYLLALFLILLLMGCSQFSNLTVPKKVTVKANPEYHLSVGAIDVQMYEDGYIESQVEEGFGYKPEGYDGDEVRLLVKSSIMEVPLDVSSYLDNVGISDKVADVSFKRTIDIPDMKISEKMNVNLSSVNDRIVNLVQFGASTAGGSLEVQIDSDESFDAITFESGTMVIETTKDLGPLEIVTLFNDGKIVASGTMTGKTCNLDMKGVTISRTGMSIDFSPNRDATNFFTAKVVDGNVASVTGLTLKETEIPFTQTINTKEQFSSFDACTIEEGQINLSLNIDNSWSNASVKYPVSLTGGITGTSTTYNGFEVINLADKVLYPEDTVVTSNVKISFTNGKINFSKVPVITFVTDIKKIKEVSLTLTDFDSTTKQSSGLGEDVFKLVRSFDLSKSEINCIYTNTLPEGNAPIAINFTSGFLGFDGIEKMHPNKENENLKFVALYDSHIVNIAREPQTDDEYNAIDFKFDIVLPGSTAENPNHVKLVGVEIGKSYEISFNIDKSDPHSIDYKWNKAVLNLEDMNLASTIDTGFGKGSFSELVENLISTEDGSTPELILSELPVYLYCIKPEGKFDGLSISGVVKAAAGDEDVYLLGNDKDAEDLPFSYSLPELVFDSSTGLITTDVSDYDKKKYTEQVPYKTMDLADAINKAGNSNVVLDYDISCSFGSDGGGFTVNSDDGISNISVMMYLVIPFKFGFKNDTCINLTKLLSMDKDLLGRSEETAQEQQNDFMKYLEYAKINYKVQKLPISCNGWKFIFNPYGEDPNHVKDASVSKFRVGTTGEIKIPNMQDLLQVYPLIPTVRIDIPGNPDENNSWICVNSSGLAKLSLDFEVKIDAEFSFDNFVGGAN